MSGLWLFPWVLALVIGNSVCVVVRSGRTTGLFTHKGQVGINITQHATINYFLQQLEHPTPEAETRSTATSPPEVRITVHSDMNDVKVNFRGYTNEYPKNANNQFDKILHRRVYTQIGGVTVQDEVHERLELIKHVEGGLTRRINWQILANFYEKVVIQDNQSLKDVQKLSTQIKHRKNGRLYRMNMAVCLKLKDPTSCYFYWHPIDGIIALAISTIRNQATMYQADWISLATKTREHNYGYGVLFSCFKGVKRKPPKQIIKLLLRMKSSHPLPSPLAVDDPNTSHYGEAHGASNLGRGQHLHKKRKREKMSLSNRRLSHEARQSTMSNSTKVEDAFSLALDQHVNLVEEEEEGRKIPLWSHKPPSVHASHHDNALDSSSIGSRECSNVDGNTCKDTFSSNERLSRGDINMPKYGKAWGSPNHEFGHHSNYSSVEDEFNNYGFSWNKPNSPLTGYPHTDDRVLGSLNHESGQHSNVEDEYYDTFSSNKALSPPPEQLINPKNDVCLGAYNLGYCTPSNAQKENDNTSSRNTFV